MKNILVLFFFCLSLSLQAQYYYNDIIGTLETNREMKSYQANKVRAVSSSGYDNNNVKATDYSEYREVKEGGRALKSTTISGMNRTVIFNRYDNQGRITESIDSSTTVQSTIIYEYDAAGRIARIQNTVKDTANDFDQKEVHLWTYNTDGKPDKMWRITTGKGSLVANDTLEVRFVADDKGNAGEEHTYRKGVQTGYLYYYYDDKGRLTDIVRYNDKLKKLMPDLMFEYDDSDRVIQRITTTSTLSIGYLIWRYIFDDKGLKTIEALFNRQKEPDGKIRYSYVF